MTVLHFIREKVPNGYVLIHQHPVVINGVEADRLAVINGMKLKNGDIIEFMGQKFEFGYTKSTMGKLLKTKNIDIHRHCLGGKPRLKGHRISVGQLIAELLEVSEDKVNEVADEFDLDREQLMEMYYDVAAFYCKRWGGQDNIPVKVLK